jgi:Flp pilus assembly pilin Flp
MSIAAGYIAVALIAGLGFFISTEIAELWDEWVISRTRVLTEEDADSDE